MAKLNAVLDSDDDLPELSTFLQSSANPAKKFLGREGHQGTQRESSLQNKTLCNQFPHIRDEDVFSENLAKSAKEVNPRSNQRSLGPLKLLQNNALFLPFTGRTSEDDSDALLARDSFRSIKSSPRRTAKAQVDNSKFIPRKSKQEPLFSESDGELSTDLSGFIVPDSATDEDVLPLRSQRSQKTKTNLRNTGKSRDAFSRKDSLDPTLSQSDEKEDTGPIDLTSPRKEEKSNRICPESPPRLKTPPKLSSAVRTCSDLDDPFSKLRLDPPKIQSASESKDILRPITPPSSLPKSKLKSPSKRNRVPASPHRPSIDAFWSADVINDWNEQYSPRKPLPSPRNKKLYSVGEDEDEISPSESPRKRSPNKSPAKRDKVATENRKAFDDKKHDLATSFLTEVDQAIGDGQVASLAESTGGIKVVWSKKLSSTAGRANWRREAIRSKSADSTVSITTHRHYASIELAEKVIDDEDRLSNVIAHEYCHLANFMISGVKDNPHGASFKSWAAKTTRAFKHRGINVTTKHTYEISYKYVWICSSELCGLEYKRHSKSIDPSKHSCGSCKGKLVQVKPVPRKGEGEGERKRSEYQDFVKREHERVRLENPGKGFGEIMVILGREFRERKKPVADLGDVRERAKSNDAARAIEGDDLDDVARKLDFLDLKA